MKRIFDLIFSFLGILIIFPLIIIASLMIFLQDKNSPLYIANRVGKNNRNFRMIKLRSMIVNADKSKVDSTSSNDPRITRIGKFIRKFKLDELTQLYNVFIGDMSLVGPRPNVMRETEIYTKLEKKLLRVKPGITDIASIVFSDESDILKNVEDPDIAYNQLIRPWKSKLGLFYIDNNNFLIDLIIIFITFLSLFSREKALGSLSILLMFLNAPQDLINISKRENLLIPSPPPGSDIIVKSRDI